MYGRTVNNRLTGSKHKKNENVSIKRIHTEESAIVELHTDFLTFAARNRNKP